MMHLPGCRRREMFVIWVPRHCVAALCSCSCHETHKHRATRIRKIILTNPLMSTMRNETIVWRERELYAMEHGVGKAMSWKNTWTPSSQDRVLTASNPRVVRAAIIIIRSDGMMMPRFLFGEFISRLLGICGDPAMRRKSRETLV